MVNRTVILFLVIILTAASSTMRIFPEDAEILFPENLSLVDFPQGNYSMLRSSGDVTQILFSKDWSVLTLYTDRKNYKDGDITGAAFSRVDSVKRTAPTLSQGDFKGISEDLLVFGNGADSSTEPFPGLAFFRDRIRSGAKYQKKGSLIRLDTAFNGSGDKQEEARLFIDALWHRCIIKVCRKEPGTGAFRCRTPLWIDETRDTHLTKLIRLFYYTFYRRTVKG